MKKFVYLFNTTLLCFFLLFISCKKEKPEVNSAVFNYSDYIYNHTSGLKSVKSSIKITFAKNLTIDKSEIQNTLAISPKITGDFDLLNNKQIVFIPKENLVGNTEYQVTLDLNKLFSKKDSLSNYIFKFKTKKQDFEVTTKNLQSYNKDWQYITGEVKTNDVTSLEKIKQVLTASQNKKNISVKFDEINIYTDLFVFKIDSIYRNVEDTYLKINYNGKPISVNKDETREIKIHGKNNFKAIDFKVVNGAEQYVEINFTDPLHKTQNLKGLISIQGITNIKYTVSGNVVKAYPNKILKGDYNVTVYRGLRNIHGYRFKENVTYSLSFEEPKPNVKFSKSGNILPNSKNLNIQFEAINLKAVEITIYKIFESNVLQFLQQNNLQGNENLKMVSRPIAKKVIPLKPKNSSSYNTWQAYGINLNELINVDKGAIYRIKLNYKQNFSTYKCSGINNNTSEEIIEENFDEEEIESSNWDNNSYYSDYENYYWRDKNNPCTSSYFANKAIYKNILATDIGITVKKGNDGTFFIATNNTVTSEPLSDVSIHFYNYQQQPLKHLKTDSEGIAIAKLSKVPFFITATKNNETTYLKVNDGNVLSMSNFNTSGAKPIKGIKGFIYTERGVWRPGDTIFMGFMLNDIKNKIPNNHPVTLELKDPNNVLKYRKVNTSGLNNLYTFKIPTKQNDITGKWNANISVGGAIFHKTLKIETIKPNRLKVLVKTDKDILTQNNKVTISSKWLHGAIAKNLKIESSLMLKPKKTTFNQYPSYVFDDPSKRFETEESNVLKSKLDANGKVNFVLNPKTNNNASGMLNAYLTTKVFENGGDFSTDVYNLTYSPFTSYVGLKRPQGDKARNMLLTDKQHVFEIVSVNENGKPVSNQNLAIKVYKMNNSWWYNNTNNYSQFSSKTFKNSVFEKTLTTNNKGKANFKFEIKYPKWGRYFVQVENKESGHSTGEIVFIDWPGWAGKAKKGNQKEAAMLMFTTDKEKYELNDEILINFPSTENGHALITIENNEKVIKHFRINTTKESTKFKFKVDESMTPNVYINITSLQPHNNTKNDLPIRMYGVKNIFVENKESHLHPTLRAPQIVEPEKEFEIIVAEQNGKPLTYTIAIVDEGLLDLTRFKTPNPWNTFNTKEALGIKTWDIYDDVIGAFGGKLNQIFSIGGDESLGAAKTQKANRFKPVVIFKGPYSLDAKEKNTHKITIPKYVGAVKTMIVAHNANNEAYGKTDASILVKKPLMILANAPRKVSVNESIKIPITVFNALDHKQNVSVKIKTNDVFSIDENKTQQISFSESGDKMVFFNIKTIKTGKGRITITAKNGKHIANYEIELESYNPIKKVTKNKQLTIATKGNEKITINGFGIKNSNKALIELSTFPQINFSDRLEYLIRYPHGCVEQTVSAVFPQLYMKDLFDLDTSAKNKINNHVNAGIQKLKSFQTLSGGFTYWPGASKTNNWATNYAGHFLVEAEKQGYLLPYNFKNNWISYQKQISRNWRKHSNNTYLEQSYRLYTLALAQKPELSMMNRLREDHNLDNISKLRLALAYAIIGQNKAAIALMRNANLINYSKVYQINHNSTLINKSIALEAYQALNNNVKARKMVEEIAKELNSNVYLNTKTTAMSLLALTHYYKSITNQPLVTSIKVNGNKHVFKTDKSIASKTVSITEGDNVFEIKNNENSPLYVKITYSGIPKINNEENISKNIITSIKYIDSNRQKLNINNLNQGTSFIVEIEIQNSTNRNIKDVAMTYQIPSGWEILNTRYAIDDASNNLNNVDYTDIRDNAIHYYFDLKKNEIKKMKVKINTTYLGKYYLPGTHTEAMYDNNYMSHTKGQWINVIP